MEGSGGHDGGPTRESQGFSRQAARVNEALMKLSPQDPEFEDKAADLLMMKKYFEENLTSPHTAEEEVMSHFPAKLLSLVRTEYCNGTNEAMTEIYAYLHMLLIRANDNDEELDDDTLMDKLAEFVKTTENCFTETARQYLRSRGDELFAVSQEAFMEDGWMTTNWLPHPGMTQNQLMMSGDVEENPGPAAVMAAAVEEAMEASHSEMSTTSRALQIRAKFMRLEIGVDVYEESNQVTPDNLLTIFGLHGLAIKHKAINWKLYCHDTDIAAMQTSAHLRSTITPLPKDRIAFTASLLLKMMADWAEPTEIQRKMMSDTLNSIQWKNQSDQSKVLADILKGDEPLTGFSTAHNLASELAPFAQVLCDPVLLAFLGTPASQKLWRALVANTVYWRVRREIGDHDRTEIIKKLLNYDEAKFTHPLPDNEQEADTGENRQGHSNEKPSFWAATNYVDPWSFLKNDKIGYRQFLQTLASLDGGEEVHQAIYDEWKHLLERDPHKHDVTAGKVLQSGKEMRKLRKDVKRMRVKRAAAAAAA